MSKYPKWVGIVAVVITFAMGGVEARAQQPKKVPHENRDAIVKTKLSIHSSAFSPLCGALCDALCPLHYCRGAAAEQHA